MTISSSYIIPKNTPIASAWYEYGDIEGGNNVWVVKTLSPFIRPSKNQAAPFWTVAGGAVASGDIEARNLIIAGGEYHVTLKNISDTNVDITMWLGFVRENTQHLHTNAESDRPWNPWLIGKEFSNVFYLSKWKRQFILKRNMADIKNDGESKKFTFKIKKQAIDTIDFIDKEKGWPVIWVLARGHITWRFKLQYQIEVSLSFFNNNINYHATKSDILELKKAIGGFDNNNVLSSTMDT